MQGRVHHTVCNWQARKGSIPSELLYHLKICSLHSKFCEFISILSAIGIKEKTYGRYENNAFDEMHSLWSPLAIWAWEINEQFQFVP